MYYWDSKSLQTEEVIMKDKLLFLWHLSSLNDNSLAKEIYNLQKEDESLPSLLGECKSFLDELQIHRNPSSYSKSEWKRLISTRIHERNKDSLLQQIMSSRKLDQEKLSTETYEEKSYLRDMSIKDGRTFFSSRSSMLSTIQWNFKGQPEFCTNGHLCVCKEHLDTQTDLLKCKLYEKQKEGLDPLNSDIELVKFFQRVLEERKKEDK